MSRFLGR